MIRLSTKEYLILDILRSNQPMYGLELVHSSNGNLKRGTVYVTLNRMEEKGYISSEQEKTTIHAGLPRRQYSMSGLGQATLAAEDAAQKCFSDMKVSHAI